MAVPDVPRVAHRFVEVDGVQVFYREVEARHYEQCADDEQPLHLRTSRLLGPRDESVGYSRGFVRQRRTRPVCARALGPHHNLYHAGHLQSHILPGMGNAAARAMDTKP